MFTSVDNYCERIDPSFWAEPLNAASNLSFIIAALLVIRLLKGQHDIATRLLTGILLMIGIGSFLFHSFAQRWAAIADVVPILLFILTFIFFATRRFLMQSTLISGLSVIGFLPFAIGSGWVIAQIFGPLNGSAGYVSVALLIGIYALVLWRTQRKTAVGLAIGAATLVVSITFRSIDQSLCATIPFGTHFIWHLLNGVMLGWMIVVLARHPKN